MIEFVFAQYNEYQIIDILLELVAVFFGVASVLLARKSNIWIFPTGLISTILFIYLTYKWSLFGDMIINIYYSTMSVYGWYIWSLKKNNIIEYPIAFITHKEKINATFIFILTIVFVILIYIWFEKFNQWTAYIDAVTTGIFFVGMWLMAKRKIENWIFWIVGDAISAPLYWYKGLVFTSIQFLIFTIIAYYGYKEWKILLQQKTINK